MRQGFKVKNFFLEPGYDGTVWLNYSTRKTGQVYILRIEKNGTISLASDVDGLTKKFKTDKQGAVRVRKETV